jgi:hypothetical protein
MIMKKAAFVVLADGASDESLGRVVNAMMGVLEFVEKQEPVQLIFDGAGTQAAAALAQRDHKYHHLFEKVRAQAIACSYCADAYEVTDKIKAMGMPLVDEFKGHPSFHTLLAAGVPVLVF